MTLLLPVIVFFSFLLVIVALQSGGSGKSKVQDRINKHVLPHSLDENQDVVIERRSRNSRLSPLGKLMEKLAQVGDIDIWIRQSGLAMSATVLCVISIILAGVVFVLLQAMKMNPIVSLIIAGAVFFLPVFYISIRRKQRMKDFSKNFPDTIAKLSNSLRAGYSLQMALETIVQDTRDIISDEFKIVLAEMEVGQNFETSLKEMLNRIDTPDLRIFIASIMIQRESGGNLTELLDNLETTIRERFQLAQELASATAQGRLSGMILAGLPIFVGSAVFLINPGYIQFFFEDPVGKQMFWMSVAGQLMGFFAIRKMVSIEM